MMNRRVFSMGVAAAAATRRTVLASANDTIRVGCVGFHGQGKVHVNAYLKIPTWKSPRYAMSTMP